jgi:ribonuclease Z
MPTRRVFSEIRLVNGSTGDPCLFVDYPGKNNALLFDAGDNGSIDLKKLGDLEAVFITHHHVDHFIGFDRIVRANLDSDKTLSVFGPTGTITKVYDRIKSYEYQYFPFQKISIRVHEILPDRMLRAVLECTQRFPEPQIEENEWRGPVAYENDELLVEAVHTEHTVPCLAFALVEKTGYHPDVEKLNTGVLRSGPWVSHVLSLLRSGESEDMMLDIEGGRFRLGSLAEQYFTSSLGARVTYITDTVWNAVTQPRLVKLSKRATRLYCDSFYSQAQSRQAQTHRHMTATQAAELAVQAKVEELVLIHFAGRYAGSYDTLVEEARAVFPRVSAVLE